jgi:hypothetical protein
MVKLMSSIAGRAYKLLGAYVHARRHNVRLPLSVSLLDARTMTVSDPYSPAMAGYLRDISKTGLSLVVPSIRFGDRFLLSGHDPLRVRVELPNGAVNIQVAPVRYDRLEEEQSERRYLIGARIMEMTASDREHLTRYIQQLKKSKAASFAFARDAKPV